MPDLDALAPQYAGDLNPLQQKQASQTQALAKLLGGRTAIGDSSPVPSVAAGIARVLQAGIEGWGARQDAERQAAQNREMLAGLIRSGGAPGPTIPAGFSATNDGAKKSADSSGGTASGPITAESNDVDQATRAVVSEAGNQGPIGMSAVANVIKNRASLTGTTPTQVVNAPGQFEAVTNGAAARIDPSSPRYQQAAAIVQNTFSGQTPDPTNGATHYYAPALQSALGRNAPKWDDGSGVKIGDHLFFSRPQDFKRRTADAGDDAAPQPDSPTAPAPAQTAQADLPMAGATETSFTLGGDSQPDANGFVIPGGGAAAVPSIRDALTSAAAAIGGDDGSSASSSPEADLPMAGATQASYTPTGDFSPDADDSGFVIPGVPTASSLAAAAPASPPSIRDALTGAANTVTGSNASSAGSDPGPDLGFFAPPPAQADGPVAGPTAPPPITNVSPAGPSGAILRPLPLGLNSALPANLAPAPADAATNPVTLAAGDTAQPIVPLPPVRPAGLPGPGDVTPNPDWRTATDTSTTLPEIGVAGSTPLPPIRPAGLGGSGDVAPSADWRTATATPSQDARAAGKVADATGSVVPTQAQRLASVLMPDTSNSNDAGAGMFARSDGGSNAQALAAMLGNSRAGQGGTSGNPDAQALGAVLAGQPVPTAASAAPAPAPSGPAPGSVMSPAPSGSTPKSTPLPASAAAPASWSTYKPDNTADPAVSVPGYDGRTWTRQQAQQAFNAKADEYPEPSEILAAQRSATVPTGGPTTTGSTSPTPAQAQPQTRGPESATPAGAPGYTPRALQALSVLANENAPASIRQVAQQIFTSEMNSTKGQVIYRDGTAYWLKGDGSAPTKFEPDTKYKTFVDPKSGRTFQYDEDTPEKMTELKAPAGSDTAIRAVTDPAERLKLGIDPADKRQALLHPNGDVTYPGSGGVSQQVNVGAQKGYAEDLAGALSEQHVALAKGANTAGERLAAIHGLQAALERIDKAGGTIGVGTSTITDLKSAANRFANAVGLDPIAGDTSDAETIRKDAMALVGQDAKSNVGTRVTNFDLSTFIKANAGLETSPTANKRILGIKEQLVQREADLGGQIQDATAAALQNGGKGPDPVAINKLIRAYDDKNHIVDPITGQDLTKSVVLPEFKGGGSTTAATGGTTTGTPRQPVATIAVAPPPQAVQALRANPALREQFDGKYGQGASSAILGR